MSQMKHIFTIFFIDSEADTVKILWYLPLMAKFVMLSGAPTNNTVDDRIQIAVYKGFK